MDTRISDHFYTAFQDFTKLTCDLIGMGELTHLKACFELAEKLYREGEWAVKHIIEDSYIATLHKFIDKSTLKGSIVRLLPIQLRKEYDRQEHEPHVKSDVSVFVIHLN